MAEDLSGFTGEAGGFDTNARAGNTTGGTGDTGIHTNTTKAADELAAAMTGGEGQTGGEPESQRAAWTAQLPKELREDAGRFKKLSGFKNIGELADAYLKGGGEADFSDVKKVMERLGAPKDGEKYEWEENLKDEMKGLAEVARKACLTRDQARFVLEGYAAYDEAKAASNLKRVREAAPKIAEGLVKEFGDEALSWHRNAVKSSGLNKALAYAGLSADPTIARALVLLGREMSEDYTPSAGSGGRGRPASVKDGGSFDYKLE